MATNAFSAQGTVLKRGNGASSEIFTSIGEIKSIQGPSGTANLLDATHLESTAKEYVLGIPDEGEIRITMNWVPSSTQHQGLITDRLNRVKRNFNIVWSDNGAAVHAFSAYVTNFEISAGTDAIVEASVTLKITGALTLTP